MNEQIHEHLSALMDGELDRDQARFLLRRLGTDKELPLRWARYHVVRQTLRRQDVVAWTAGLADAVMARVELEPVAAHDRANWLRWGGGGAIAASVAVAALMLTRPSIENSVPAEPQASLAARGAPARTSTPASLATTSALSDEFRAPLLVPNTPVDTAPASYGTESGQPIIIDPRMQSYLIRHYQAAGAAGQSGFVPYVLLANPQHDAGFAQPAEPVRQNR